MSFRLTGPARRELREILLKAFSRGELKSALAHSEPARNFEALVPNVSLRQQVFELIATAEREGWLDQITEILETERPQRQDLIAAAATLIEGGGPSGTDPEPVSVCYEVILGILVSGDPSEVFRGDYRDLTASYLAPWPVFQRVDLANYSPRNWLFSAIDAFLAEETRGVFVLEAGAGLGKTAVMAKLVADRGYVHHFVELSPGLTGIGRGLESLACQLIVAWRLDHYLTGGGLPSAAASPGFLQGLLFDAARERDEVKPEEKIVLVVDALDESGAPSSHNVMGLPRVLPKGVYLIVSQRPVQITLNIEGPRKVLSWQADDERNRGDMMTFLASAAKRPALARGLQQRQISEHEFTRRLLDRGGGVWIYSQYLLQDFERDPSRLIDVGDLPTGLWQYYARFWNTWRDQHTEWHHHILPLLGVLGAAQEDFPTETLCTFAGVEPSTEIRRLFEETWRPFLAVREEPARYRIYHASLRDFLDGSVDMTRLTSQERSLAKEMAAATRTAHGRIADHYLNAWGGLEQGLPGLEDAKLRELEGGYGFRHLVLHLKCAGRVSDLGRLLAIERQTSRERRIYRLGWRGRLDRMRGHRRFEKVRGEANAWYLVHDEMGGLSGFLADLELCWQAAEEASQKQIDSKSPATHTALEIRCALLTASVNSLARNIGAGLLTSVVKRQIWSPRQALAYALSIPAPDYGAPARDLSYSSSGYPLRRATALLDLQSHLEEPDRSRALAEVVTAYQFFSNYTELGKQLLDALPAQLPLAVWSQILSTTLGLDNDLQRAEMLIKLARKLPTSLLKDVTPVVDQVEDDHRARLLAALASRRRGDEGRPLLDQALEAARGCSIEPTRTLTLLELAPDLTREQRARVFEEVFANGVVGAAGVGSRARSAEQSASIPAEAAAVSESPEDRRFARQALETLRELPGTTNIESILAKLLPSLDQESFDELEAIAREKADPWTQASFEAAIAQRAAELGLVDEALRRVQAIDLRYSFGRAKALTGIAPHLTAERVEDALMLALESYPTHRSEALAALAPYLPEPLLHRALEATLEIGDSYEINLACEQIAHDLATAGGTEEVLRWAMSGPQFGGRALAHAAPFLDRERLEEVVHTVRNWRDDDELAAALSGLARHSEGQSRRLAREAHAAARRISSRYTRVQAVTRIIPLLDKGPQRRAVRKLLQDFRELARDHGLEWLVQHCLEKLIPAIPDPLKREALGAAGVVSYRLQELTPALASGLPEERLVREICETSRHDLLRNSSIGRPAAMVPGDSGAPSGLRWQLTSALAELLERIPKSLIAWPVAIQRWAVHHEDLNSALSRCQRDASDSWTLGLWAGRMLGDREFIARRRVAKSTDEHRYHLGAFDSALSAIRRCSDPGLRVELLLTLLTHHWRPDLLSEALLACLAIADPSLRAQKLAVLRAHLSEDLKHRLDVAIEVRAERHQVTEETLAAIQEIANPLSSLRALRHLIPRLSRDKAEEEIRRLMESPDSHRHPGSKFLVQAIARVSPEPTEKLVSELWDAVRVHGLRIRDKDVFEALISAIPQSAVPGALGVARDLLRGHPGDRDRRADRALSSRLASLPAPQAHDLLKATLRKSAKQDRARLANDLVVLASMISAVGGLDAIQQTFRGLQDVKRLWP